MKITERDKALLVLLGVILIVALAIMVPGVGIMACRTKLAEIKTDTSELQYELDQTDATLEAMGVNEYKENASSAAETLKERVFGLKVEASHLAGNVMAYAKPYAVDEEWVDGLEYRYGIKSDDGEKILQYSPIADVEAVGNQTEETFSIDGVNYTLPSAKREINYSVPDSSECYYVTEVAGADVAFEDIGSLLLYLHNISSKGSILITEVRHGGDSNRISFTLVMPPEGSGIARYAQEVQEELARRALEEGEAEEEE